jgi:hypothetical protein
VMQKQRFIGAVLIMKKELKTNLRSNAQNKPIDTGTYVYFIRYRKLLTVMSIVVLLFLPFKVYDAPAFDEVHKYQDIGFCLDTLLMFVVCPVWILYNVRKANKAYRNEEEWKKM